MYFKYCPSLHCTNLYEDTATTCEMTSSLRLIAGRRPCTFSFAVCHEQYVSEGKTHRTTVFNTGLVTSPFYPKYYGSDVDCLYRFLAQRDERVRLTFVDFDLGDFSETPQLYVFIIRGVVVSVNGFKCRSECGERFNKRPPIRLSLECRQRMRTAKTTHTHTHKHTRLAVQYSCITVPAIANVFDRLSTFNVSAYRPIYAIVKHTCSSIYISCSVIT